MAETGVGGAYLMPIGNSHALANAAPLTIADPPANPLSEHWWKLVVHATKEADRLGMRLAMNACDGWALAGGPWITPEMYSAYVELHRLGFAHSVECWQGDELVGGIYGVCLGRCFFGESMFSRCGNASKVALAHLVEKLGQLGFELLCTILLVSRH